VDVGKLYGSFQEFATKAGPVKNLNSLTESQRRTKMANIREDYLFFFADIAQNSTSLYTSKGLIKNASTALLMQGKISESVNALGGKMSKTTTYIQLSNRLEALHDIVSNLGMALQELQTVIKKVKDPPSQRYPKMKTRQGDNQFVDKLYYDVLSEWLRVLAHCHKLENAVRNMSAQFAKVEGLKRIASNYATELDTLPQILSTYKSIDNEAKAIFPDYRPMRFESKIKFQKAVDRVTGREAKRRSLVEANTKLLSRLEEIF
jgi:hypothetical protein